MTALDDEYWGELLGQDGSSPLPATLDAAVNAPAAAVSATAAPAPAKPTGFVLLGQHHAAATWREVLVGVCAVLAQRHGAAFGPTAAAVKGRKRQYIAASPTGMITPAKIPGAELWIETNQSAKSVMQVLGKPLVALGHSPEELTIG